jgi:very-short-patch-repair endonuclease
MLNIEVTEVFTGCFPVHGWGPLPSADTLSGGSLATSSRLYDFADRLRTNPTKYEVMLWKWLKRGVKGVNFEQQIVIAGYIVDFYCHDARLAVELDGKQHDIHRDAQRDQRISTKGVMVMRFPNPRRYEDVTSILFKVWPECRHRIARGLRYSSTNPQGSQHQQGSDFVFYKKDQEKSIKRLTSASSVEKISTEVDNFITAKALEDPQDKHNRPQGCGRQVYSTMEVAESTVAGFMRMGLIYRGWAERCEKCGLIHVREVVKAATA